MPDILNFYHVIQVIPGEISAMKSRHVSILLLAAGFLLFATAGFGQDLSCTPVLEKKCTECHDISTICAKVKKKKSPATWKDTLATMVDEGASVSKAENKMLVHCLSKPTDEIRSLCQLSQ